MAAAPGALEDHLGYWLRLVSNQVSQAFAARLAGAGVSVAEWVVLRLLFDAPGLAPSVLADRLGMTRGAITKLSDRLIAAGLVARTPRAGDGRGQALSLTPEGGDLVPRLAAMADANEAEFFASLPADDRARLEAILREIAGRRGRAIIPTE